MNPVAFRLPQPGEHSPSVIIADTNTAPLLPRHLPWTEGVPLIVVPAGEQHKSITEAVRIWEQFHSLRLDRHCVVWNFGGGVVTDLGGFASSTFKRGLPFVNIPTTLLSMVDASVGGKTGIDFCGMKNEVGTFAEPLCTYIHTPLTSTLPRAELHSGMGEVIKTLLLTPGNEALLEECLRDGALPSDALVERCVRIKEEFVSADPHEKGLRKALNLGHTFGHAFESLAASKQSPIPHGTAVAWGLVVALQMSGLDALADRLLRALRSQGWHPLPHTADDIPALIEMMRHDKKNIGSESVHLTLLASPGVPRIDVATPPEDLREPLVHFFARL